MARDAAADISILLREQVAEGNAIEHVLTLRSDEILHIGRSSKLPHPRLLFPSDPELSSRHAVLMPKFRSKRARSGVAGSEGQGHRYLDTRGISIKDLGSLNGTFRNGERLTAKRVMKVSLGDTFQVGTVQFKLVRVTALNPALSAPSSPKAAQNASKPRQSATAASGAAAVSQTTLTSAVSCVEAPAAKRKAVLAAVAGSPLAPAQAPASPAGPSPRNRTGVLSLGTPTAPPTPSPAAVCSPVVVDLLLSGGGSSSASPLRSQQTAASAPVPPQLPQSKYTRTQLHAALSPSSPPRASAPAGTGRDAAPPPSNASGSTGEDRLAQLHAALTMIVSSQESAQAAAPSGDDEGCIGGLDATLQSDSEADAAGGDNASHAASSAASVQSVGVEAVSVSSPAARPAAGVIRSTDSAPAAATGQNATHMPGDESDDEGVLEMGVEEGALADDADEERVIGQQLPPPSANAKGNAPGCEQGSSARDAALGDVNGVSSPLACRGPADLWSDASITSAPSLALQRRLLALGVQPKRKRADNCALLKRVQKLILQEPPWELPSEGGGASDPEGGGGRAPRGGLSAKAITPNMVRQAILADHALHELVLIQAPVPLERFVSALASSADLKNATSPSVAAAVREILQVDGILFTSAWR